MKIAFLLDGFDIGGTELNATRTLEAFARRSVLVDVLHFHADGPLRERIVTAGHRLTHVPIAPLSSPRILPRIIALSSAIGRAGAQVVHAQDVYTNILGVAAARYVRRRAVLTSRRWKNDVPREGLTPLNAWAHRHSTLVLPNSGTLIETLRAERVPASRITVHENFVDDRALELMGASDVTAWRSSLGIPVGAVVVGCVARLARVKQHAVLLSAFARIMESVPEAHLVLVGDGEERRSLSTQAEELGLGARIHFPGTLPNSPLPQQLFDIGVLVSENEGFPNSLVEASACGIPIVATMVGGVRDVLIDGKTGFGVAVGNVDATADAILSLLRDRDQRTRLGDAGRQHVIARFSESAAIDRLLGLYASVTPA